MADYTFPSAPVLVEGTAEFAAKGTTGVLRANAGGPALAMYDLNDSVIPHTTVGERGAHEAFKADVPHGVLDFGSTELVAISRESLTAALEAVETAESALSQVNTMQTSKAAASHKHVAADMDTTSGTPSATTFLRGDNTWATPSGGGGGMVDGGTATSTFTDVILDGGGAAQ